MRHTKYKWFFAWDYEKEEKWLNEMSAKGLQLVHAGIGRYVFEENHNDKYQYRLELLDNLPSHSESVSYIRFLEETGVEHVDSVLRWAYFRKNARDGEFELYSDIESKIKHYKRLIFLFIAVMPVNIINAVNTLNQYIETRITAELSLSIVCFIIFSLLGTGVFKVSKQIRRLKKNKLLSE